MSNKTLYVRDEDDAVWDKARDYAGESLSSFITNHLKNYVASKEAEVGDFQRIVIQYRDRNGVPLAKAFKGRWLIDPPHYQEWLMHYYALAVSPKGNFIIVKFNGFKKDALTGAEINIKSAEEIKKFPHGYPPEIVATILEQRPIPIEELDI